MSLTIPETAPVSSDRIEIYIRDRTYGAEVDNDVKYEQKLPSCVSVFVPELEKKSRILSLQLSADVTRDTIFDAYSHDLGMLKSRVNDFETWVKSAVFCSIRTQHQGDEKEKTWEWLKNQIPEMAKSALIKLPHTLASQDVPVLLPQLQEEFKNGVNRMLRLFAFWLQFLVEENLVGLVEWTADDVCRYHYFLHDHTKEVLDENTRIEETLDDSKSFGERRQVTEIKDTTIRRKYFRERHVHHIVKAKTHGLEEYPHKVPSRIATFLGSAPVWLRPHLRIVEGQITMEEILRRDVDEATVVESQVIDTYTYSPGVLLGEYNLVGWSGMNLRDENISFYIGQAVRKPARSRSIRNGLMIATASVAFLIASIWAISEITHHYDVEHAEQYAAYMATFDSQNVLETVKGESIRLPGNSPLRYAGLNPNFKRVILSEPLKAEGTFPKTHGFGLEHKDYGDIDLSGLGIFVKLHVLSATDYSISYVVESYGQ